MFKTKKSLVAFVVIAMAAIMIALAFFINSFVSPADYCGEYKYGSLVFNFLGEGPFDSRDEQYTLTEDTLTIRLEDGSVSSYPITLQWTEVDILRAPAAWDISMYRQRHMLVEESSECPYRIYVMDDEMWLMYVVSQERANGDKVTVIHWAYVMEEAEGAA